MAYVNCTIQYTFPSQLTSLVREEISKVAASTFGEGGISLYDAIIPYSRDNNVIENLIHDAENEVVARISDICTIMPRTSSPGMNIYVPDFIPQNCSIVEEELTRFIVMTTVSFWLVSRSQPRVEEFATRATGALNKAIKLIKTRKNPEE